ncbi:general secretion pathway protein GspC [Ectopseudomonas chengduensis]|nr:general secretion pathway protein GspC [Pseudomonas chengduensis]UZT80835.1 general secretion pathway protein GspC [Pseudomonas chengduensis]
MRHFHHLDPAVLVQVLALLVALAGIAVWGTLLNATVPTPTPAQASREPARTAHTTEQGAAQWFSSSARHVQVNVSGLLAGPEGAVAILSIDDEPPRAFLANEQLAEGVHLRRIEHDAVVIDRGGSESRLAIAELPVPVELPSLR